MQKLLLSGATPFPQVKAGEALRQSESFAAKVGPDGEGVDTLRRWCNAGGRMFSKRAAHGGLAGAAIFAATHHEMKTRRMPADFHDRASWFGDIGNEGPRS
jgi:hypothetical protein